MLSIFLFIFKYVWCECVMASPLVNQLKRALSPRSPLARLKSPFKKNFSKRSPLFFKQKHLTASPAFKQFQKRLFQDDECTITKINVPKVKHVLTLEPNVNSLLDRGIDERNFYVLGKGSFGTVVLCNLKEKKVAAKIVKNVSTMSRELNALILSHPNVVDVIQVIHNPKKPHGIVVMEPWSPITLQGVVDESLRLNLEDSIRLLMGVTEALSYCHEVGVVHLDLKPKNILVDLKEMKSKLCDFGNSHNMNSNVIPPYHQGTVPYIAPELLKGLSVTDKCDVYSFGITMWQILHKENPFTGMERHVIIYQVVSNGFRPKTNPQHKAEAKGFIKLYEKCWQQEPAERPAIWEVGGFLQTLLSKT